MGGLEDSEDNEWSMLAQMPAKRKMFVESVIRFLKRWNFDGMQLAWQYPVCKQVSILYYKQTLSFQFYTYKKFGPVEDVLHTFFYIRL